MKRFTLALLRKPHLLLLGLLAFGLIACQEDDSPDVGAIPEAIDEAIDVHAAESEVEGSENILAVVLDTLGTSASPSAAGTAATNNGPWALPSGAEVTVTKDNDIWYVTIDFGDEGVLCNDLRFRRGKLHASATGRYVQAGSVFTYWSEDYYVSLNPETLGWTRHQWRRTVENTDGTTWEIAGRDTVTLSRERGTILWETDRTRSWTEGTETASRLDDVFTLSGTYQVTRPGGCVVTGETLSPLVYQVNCRHIVSGIVQRTNTCNDRVVTIDYGSGCDPRATISVNGQSSTVSL